MEVELPVSWFVGCVTDRVVVKFAVVDFARVVGAWVVTVCAVVEGVSVVVMVAVCVVEGFLDWVVGAPVVCAWVLIECVDGFPVTVVVLVITECVGILVASVIVVVVVGVPAIVVVAGIPVVVTVWVGDEVTSCVVAEVVSTMQPSYNFQYRINYLNCYDLNRSFESVTNSVLKEAFKQNKDLPSRHNFLTHWLIIF